ncbi:MAG: hypothetical protein ACFFE8_00540 [Candidatus Heimdallarchaeota archaeon]
MTSRKRVLCVGREVGPLGHLLKETVPNLQIGAIDVLGNIDTRQYVDWAFSVEKQVADQSIYRPKRRSLEELLFELTQVMLEEISFDLVIPSSPFQTKLDYLKKISEQTEVSMPEVSTLEKVTTAFHFVTNLEDCCPSFLRALKNKILISEIVNDDLPGILITEKGNFVLKTPSYLNTISSQKLEGFYARTSNIHVAFFLDSGHQSQFWGVQTVAPPYHHPIFPNFLERNSLIPYSASETSPILEVKQFGQELINNLDLSGMITLYFCKTDQQLVPLSCSLLPDENLRLWGRNHPNLVVKFLMTPSRESNPISPPNDFVYRIPIYSRFPLKVPSFPEGACSQKNLANSLSHHEYPICVITGTGETKNSAEERQMKELTEITRYFELYGQE